MEGRGQAGLPQVVGHLEVGSQGRSSGVVKEYSWLYFWFETKGEINATDSY